MREIRLSKFPDKTNEGRWNMAVPSRGEKGDKSESQDLPEGPPRVILRRGCIRANEESLLMPFDCPR